MKQYTLKKLRSFNAVVVEFLSFYFVMNCLVRPSANRKTGTTIQTFFIDKARIENEPSVFGSKCESCSAVNYCYVTRDKLAVRKALVSLIGGDKTSYKFVTFEQALTCLRESQFNKIRIGSYGDPSIMPINDLIAICETKKHLSYTHFWNDENLQDLRKVCMASTSNIAEDLEAKALGWRTFRVRLEKDDVVLPSAIQCLYEARNIQCVKCGLCDGIALDDKRKHVSDIWIYGHGSAHKKIFGEIK